MRSHPMLAPHLYLDFERAMDERDEAALHVAARGILDAFGVAIDEAMEQDEVEDEVSLRRDRREWRKLVTALEAGASFNWRGI